MKFNVPTNNVKKSYCIITYTMIQKTGKLSLGVQIVTGLIDAFVLTLPRSPGLQILRQLLFLELIVQVIEGSFYVWMLRQFDEVKNVTPVRYYDWAITTPTMLFTLCMYFIFLRDNPTGKQDEEKTETTPRKSLWTYTKEYATPLSWIILMDWLMLLFGYLGELNIMSTITSTLWGFIPFGVMYAIIYANFAQVNNTTLTMYWYFVAVWSLYGVAALLPYTWKNAFYNILDLFAKNFFGLFLAYTIYMAN